MAMTELARAGLAGNSRPRKRVSDGNGATVCILPARDGYAAISPREDRQWAAWLDGDGLARLGPRPALRHEARPGRQLGCAACADVGVEPAARQAVDRRQAQAAHVPSFPLREPAEQLASAQLAHRNFYRPVEIAGRKVKVPGPPFGLRIRDRRATGRGLPRAARPDAALRRARARFQLGHRRPDGDALSGGDGRGGDQGRGPGPRRSRPRLRIAHGAWPGASAASFST